MEINELLCKDFLWHVRVLKHPAIVFINDWEKARLGQKWLEYFVAIPCKTIENKCKRNRLMCEFAKCMEAGELREPFLRPPRELERLQTPHCSPHRYYNVNSPQFCPHSNLRILLANFPPFGRAKAACSRTSGVRHTCEEGENELAQDSIAHPKTSTMESSGSNCSVQTCNTTCTVAKKALTNSKDLHLLMNEINNTISTDSVGTQRTAVTFDAKKDDKHTDAQVKHTHAEAALASTSTAHCKNCPLYVPKDHSPRSYDSHLTQSMQNIVDAVTNSREAKNGDTLEMFNELEPALTKSCLNYMKKNVLRLLEDLAVDGPDEGISPRERSYRQTYKQFIQDCCLTELEKKKEKHNNPKEPECKLKERQCGGSCKHNASSSPKQSSKQTNNNQKSPRSLVIKDSESNYFTAKEFGGRNEASTMHSYSPRVNRSSQSPRGTEVLMQSARSARANEIPETERTDKPHECNYLKSNEYGGRKLVSHYTQVSPPPKISPRVEYIVTRASGDTPALMESSGAQGGSVRVSQRRTQDRSARQPPVHHQRRRNPVQHVGVCCPSHPKITESHYQKLITPEPEQARVPQVPPKIPPEMIALIERLLHAIKSEELRLVGSYVSEELEVELLAYAMSINPNEMSSEIVVELKNNKILREFVMIHFKADLQAMLAKLKPKCCHHGSDMSARPTLAHNSSTVKQTK